jgi:cobalt-zinc-cadmium resistance protein CzcA
MQRFNALAKPGLIRNTGTQMGKAIFFSKLIIISALIPIFSFEKVEGKMFSPLAWTLGFALLGALIFTLTLVPVLSSILLNKNVSEKQTFFTRFINKIIARGFSWTFTHKRTTILFTAACSVLSVLSIRLTTH